MTRADIQRWLSYWQNANEVAVEEIRTEADVPVARRFCEVMRAGVFATITDKAIWEALTEMRAAHRMSGVAPSATPAGAFGKVPATTCSACGGEGSFERPHPFRDDPYFSEVVTCEACNGAGYVSSTPTVAAQAHSALEEIF